MAEQRIEPTGCLGRVFTLLGVIWIGVVVFAGVFGLRDSPGTLGALVGSTVPGLVFIAIGRVLSRRAAERREAPALPQTTPRPSASPPPEPAAPRSQPSEVFPKPARAAPSPAPEADLPPELPPPPIAAPPKSSREMIEEAHRRWGSGAPRTRDGD
jgi:hypothetical protein